MDHNRRMKDLYFSLVGTSNDLGEMYGQLEDFYPGDVDILGRISIARDLLGYVQTEVENEITWGT